MKTVKTASMMDGEETEVAILRLNLNELSERGAVIYTEDGGVLHGVLTVEFPVAPGSGEAGRTMYEHAKAVGLDNYEAECIVNEAVASINRRVFVRLLR